MLTRIGESLRNYRARAGALKWVWPSGTWGSVVGAWSALLGPAAREGDRHPSRLAFRPVLEGRSLEPRIALSATPFALNQYILTHPQPGVAKRLGKPPQFNGEYAFKPHGPNYNHGYVATQVAHGGQSVIVAAPDGSRFRVALSLADNQYDGTLSQETGSSGINAVPSTATSNNSNAGTFVAQPQGTVRAYAMPGGRVGLIVDGSTSQEQLTIDPLPFSQRKGYAHSFAYGEAGRSHVLNVGSIQINSGALQDVLGFHSANLSGPLSIGGTQTVDRIAFNSLLPGASIGVGGTLNTLDVATSANLTSGPGVSAGLDVNLLNVGGDLTLANGAVMNVGRFAGLTPQPPKGTSTGSNFLSLNQSQIGTGTAVLTPSVSAYIQGNLTIGAGSVFRIASGIANSSVIQPTTTGQLAGGSPSPFLINGTLNLASGTVLPLTANTGVIASPQFIVPGNIFSNAILPTTNVVARNGLIIGGTTVLGPS